MTPEEALKEITSNPKWYVVLNNNGKTRNTVKESTLRVTALRILNNNAESSSMRRFFERFGYKLNITIIKNNEK